MRRFRLPLMLAALFTLNATPPALRSALAQTAPAPMYVEVFFRAEKREQKLAGKLLEHDVERIVIDTPTGPRELTWDQLTASSAFTLKSRLIDKTSAGDWLALGEWGWAHGLEQQGKAAFAQARKLDGSVARRIEAALAKKSGSAIKPAGAPGTATQGVASEGAGAAPPPATMPSPPDGTAATAAPASADSKPMQAGYTPGQKITRYKPPTADEVKTALAQTRKEAADACVAMKIELVEVETPHFLIYTDWDPREHNFLKDKCEGAYRVVAKQFNQSPTDNVFLGKLPVYMFKNQSDFQRFARKVDDFAAPATVLGYFKPTETMGHMAMWKPGIGGEGIGAGGSRPEAEKNWARTLVHEFAHAFIHRYKSNATIPRWMNEGTAELISEAELPTNNYRYLARECARLNIDIEPLYDDSTMPSGAYYPVMMTMVECLVKQDQKKFIAMFNDIKDGTEPEDALTKHYGINYGKLTEGWRKYAKALK